MSAPAQDFRQSRNGLSEPIHRVANNNNNSASGQAPLAAPAEQPQGHPLDPALKLAYEGVQNIQANIVDYTATMHKRERVSGTLGETEQMFIKVRNRKLHNGRVTTPFSIYIKFLYPKSKAGREVIYVEGANDNKLLAHETPGLRNFITARLDPTGYLAMLGNRHPITEAGLENLVAKLIEKGERDRQHGEVEVQFFKGAKIDDRVCTLLQVTHPTPREHFDFHVAQVFIDDELRIPVRYSAFQWPTAADGKPELEEEYTYTNVKLNVGLTDADFDSKNTGYKFP